MSKDKLAISSAYLATKEKSEERKLLVGKANVDKTTQSQVFYLLEILSPWLPTNKVEVTISEILKKSAENKPDYSADDFEETLRDINHAIGTLASEKEIDWVGNINAIIGYAEGSKLHLSMFGNIDGYLIRDSKISKVTEGISDTNPNPTKLFSSITSGGLKKHDRVIISNVSLYDNISIERSRRIAANLDARESLKEFHSILRKMRAHNINIAILEVVDQQEIAPENRDDERYPEFLFLDQAQKTVWDEIKKRARPALITAKAGAIKGGKKTGVALGNMFRHTHKKIKENYGPKTKEALGSASKQTKKSFSGISGIFQGKNTTRSSEIKVKPYKSQAGWFSGLRRVSSNFVNKSAPFIKRSWLWLIKKENRRYVYIGLAIVLIIIVYFKITANNSNRSEIKDERDSIVAVADAKDLFNQAKEDMALKREGGEDKLYDALDKAELAANHPTTKDEATALVKEIQEKIDELTGAVRFSGLEPLFFVKDNTLASELVGSSIYSVTSDGKIFATDTREKNPTLVASIGEDKGQVIDISYAESVDTLYIYTSENKILGLDTTTDTIEEVRVSQDGNDWQKSVALSTYSSNIYSLDSETGEVWRHSKLDDGFSKGIDYLDTRKISIKDAIDLTIDGSIFVLKADSSVAKFVRGSWDSDFILGEIPSPGSTIDEPVEIFTDSDSNFIYILDRALNRIIRFEKAGQYSNQFIFDDFEIEQFFVNPRLQNMWLISGGNVYEVSL